MYALLRFALLPLLAATLACGRERAPAAGRPANLLLVTIDTLRRDHVGAYGDAAAETPALDRLAREGVRFDQATATAPLTLVSHASLLSGLLPPHHGVRNNGYGRYPEDRATLATRLAAAGYRTGAFVGSFVLDRRFGLGRGFATYDDAVEREPGARPTLEAERPADRVVDGALAWLGKEDPRPFFLWVHLYDPHAPYAPPEPYRGRHAASPYDGEIAFADAQLGRLLAELDRRGLAGSTAVAVAADHGEALGEHGEMTHGLLLYEPTLRVPLLVRAPGLAAGRVVASPVSLVDLAPTLAGLLGRPFPAEEGKPLDGRDLSPALLAGAEPAPADLYAETRYPEVFGWSGLTMLRRRDVKFIAAPRPELYDLGRDPGETANLAAAPGEAARLRGFAARVAEIEAGARAGGSNASPDAETRARLASLGYVAAGAAGKPRTAGPAASRPDPKDKVGLFRRFEAAAGELRAGHLEMALPELEALAAADPGNPVFRGKLAQGWRESGRLERAVPLYRQAVAAAPADPDAWYDLAVALQETGRLDEARTVVAEAMRLDPARPEAHNTLGIVHLAEGRLEEARGEFARTVELDPGNAPAWNNLGNALRALGRLAEAETAYRRATAASPRYPEPWNGLGTLAVQRDRPRQALAFFDRALALAPAYHEVLLNRGIAYELSGDRPAAVAAYRDFLAAAGESPQFSEQREAARQLLARLSGPSGPEERR